MVEEREPQTRLSAFQGITLELGGSPIDRELRQEEETFRENFDYFHSHVVGNKNYSGRIVMVINQQVVAAIFREDYKVEPKQKEFWEEAQKKCEEMGFEMANSYCGFVPEDMSQYKRSIEVKVSIIPTTDDDINNLVFKTVILNSRLYPGELVLISNGQVVDHARIETARQLGKWMWGAQKKCEAVGGDRGFVGFVPEDAGHESKT